MDLEVTKTLARFFFQDRLEKKQDAKNCDERLEAFFQDQERDSKWEHWNSPDEFGNTLLHSAVNFNNDSVLQDLLKTGSKVDVQNNAGKTGLMIAVRKICKKTIEILLEAGANPNVMDMEHQSALYYLYSYNQTHSDEHLEILKMLIDRGALVNLTVDNKNYSQVDLILQYGNREAIDILMQANLDLTRINEDGNTPVHILAKNQNPEVFKALDDCKFDVNARNFKFQTLLFFAVIYGNSHTVQYLINRGANVNAVNGSSGLVSHHAIYNFVTNCGEQYKKCVELLLENSAYVQLRTETLKGLSKILGNVRNQLSENARKIAVAYLVVQEALGTKIAIQTRIAIDFEPILKTFYEFCQQQVTTIVDKSVRLLDLLAASEIQFEKYMHNQILALKIQEICKEKMSDSYCLLTILQMRISKALQMIELKRICADLLSSLMKAEYAIVHLIVDRIISYLSEQDLHYLSQISF